MKKSPPVYLEHWRSTWDPENIFPEQNGFLLKDEQFLTV
jgi:hypothetical protein